jgi:hypothetical protein
MRCESSPRPNVIRRGLTVFGRPCCAFSIAFLVITFLATLPALVRDEAPARVGRVSLVSAVATGTSLWTDPDARAEIRIGPSTISMASSTELDVGWLTAAVTQINLPQGRLRRADSTCMCAN